MNSNLENEAIKLLENSNMQEMFTFVVDMLAAYSTDKLKVMKESVIGSSDIQNNEVIMMVIDEILKLRGEL